MYVHEETLTGLSVTPVFRERLDSWWSVRQPTDTLFRFSDFRLVPADALWVDSTFLAFVKFLLAVLCAFGVVMGFNQI